MSAFKRISADVADHILATETNNMLLDIRDNHSYEENHHPQALHFTDTLLRKLLNITNKNTHILIYCYHGNSSQDIAKMLSDFGFKNCYSVDGGYTAWRFQITNEFKLSASLKTWLEQRDYDTENIDARIDNEFKTPLMAAAKMGNVRIVQSLIDAGANPNLHDTDGNNTLWYACMSQSYECVRMLLKADVEVDNQNNHGFTPLNYAVGIEPIFNLLANYFENDSLLRLTQPANQSALNEAIA